MAYGQEHKPIINEINFDVNHLYPDNKEKIKFEEQKNLFLAQWLDSTNCYRGKSRLDNIWWQFYRKYTKDIYVDNILRNNRGDTLLVLVTAYAVEKNEDESIKNDRTFSVGMGINIDSLDQWKFNCNGGISWIISKQDNHEMQILQLRRLVLRNGFLKEDGSIDPLFWKRLYQNNKVH